jgi:DNA-binding response OmpR family regulator
VKQVLVFEDDSDACRLICNALRGASLGAERAHTELTAYRRIPSLPTLDGLIVNLDRREGAEIARFARQVIPKIAIVYFGTGEGGATPRRLSLPPGEFVASPPGVEDLTRALRRAFMEVV